MKARNAFSRAPQTPLNARQAPTPNTAKAQTSPRSGSERDSFEHLPRERVSAARKQFHLKSVVGRAFHQSRGTGVAATVGSVAMIPASLIAAPATRELGGSSVTENVQYDAGMAQSIAQEVLQPQSKAAPRAEPQNTNATPEVLEHKGLEPDFLKASTDGNQIKAWRKTTEKNGSAVATIKAAVDCYGKTGVFKQIVKNDDGSYDVKLQNGKSVHITADELSKTSQGSKFEELGEGKDVDFANFAFAVMTKESKSANEFSSFSKALKDLNGGEWPLKCASYLGIPANQIEDLSDRSFEGKDSIVAWGSSAVMVDERVADGKSKHVYDDRGTERAFSNERHPDALGLLTQKEVAKRRAALSERLRNIMANHEGISPELLKPTEDGNQIKAWRQTTEGNCASIATVKAAVDCYGKAGVFNKIKKNADGSYDIKLQNGRDVHITKAELEKTKSGSDFKELGKGSDIKFANLAFSVMIKENQRMYGMSSFTKSMNDLNSGEFPIKCASYLGIPKGQIEHLTNKSKRGKDSICAWNSAHAVMVDSKKSGSHVYDSYGSVREYTGRRYPNAFRFLPAQ